MHSKDYIDEGLTKEGQTDKAPAAMETAAAVDEPVSVSVVRPAANLGEQLRAHRKRLGLTQLEAAEQIGISRSYLARIENGSSQRVGKDTREKVLAWLNG